MNSLAAAALVVLALNPAYLFNVGAQLSFLCVAGLIWLGGQRADTDWSDDPLERMVVANLGWLARSRHHLISWLIDLAIIGVVIGLLTLPLVAARFHIVSPVSLLLNTVLWIPMSLSVLAGFGVLAFGTIFPPLAYLSGWLSELNFLALEWVINIACRLPGSHFWTSGPADWWLVGFYGGLALLWAFPALRLSRRGYAMLLVAWIAVGLVPRFWPRDGDRLDCTFLSMGHGCAVFMETPGGRTLLYDAGQLGAPSAGVRTLSNYLWKRGISRLDVVMLSHPDTDHYNALPGLLGKFSVGEVWVSPAMFKTKSHAVCYLRDALMSHGVVVREVIVGERLAEPSGCTVEILHPHGHQAAGNDNAGSLVAVVSHHQRRILLPGDLESPGLEALLAGAPQPATVLLAPHHGSRKSNSPALARWSSPAYVVFSGDGRWSLPESEAAYHAVGSRVLHTFDGGAIQVEIDAAGATVSSFVDR
jgi:competence protein ComEC